MDSYYGNGSSKINANVNMIDINIYNMVGGFKHFFIFHNIWDNPSHSLICFKMVNTTNQSIINHH